MKLLKEDANQKSKIEDQVMFTMIQNKQYVQNVVQKN